jgi:hypothetical protein
MDSPVNHPGERCVPKRAGDAFLWRSPDRRYGLRKGDRDMAAVQFAKGYAERRESSGVVFTGRRDLSPRLGGLAQRNGFLLSLIEEEFELSFWPD